MKIKTPRELELYESVEQWAKIASNFRKERDLWKRNFAILEDIANDLLEGDRIPRVTLIAYKDIRLELERRMKEDKWKI